MTAKTLTGKQVLALLAQDEVPGIEQQSPTGLWHPLQRSSWDDLRKTHTKFRIKPKPQRRLSVTLAKDKLAPKWHWTADEYNASSAWSCHFGYGDQDGGHKSFEASAVAVRCIRLTA